jgi:ankyrin repeat protein
MMSRKAFCEPEKMKELHYQLMVAIFSRGTDSFVDSEKIKEPCILLEKYGSEVDINSFFEGDTLLSIAVFYRQIDVIEKLLVLGADPDIGDHQFSVPLLIIGVGVGEESLKTCQMLIDAGANVNCRDWFGQSPLWIASACENTGILILLLEKGAFVDAINHDATTPLMRASQHGLYENVQILLDYGASPYMVDGSGNTALDYAKVEGNRLFDVGEASGHNTIIHLLQSY